MPTTHTCYAAIDIGSNAVRLLIKKVKEDETVLNKRLSKVLLLRVPLRLGFDVFSLGEVSETKAVKLRRLMKAFRQLMKIYDVTDYRACATSAMRDARNGKSIIKKILKDTGISIEVIDGQEEARMVYNNHIECMADRTGNYIYVDVVVAVLRLICWLTENCNIPCLTTSVRYVCLVVRSARRCGDKCMMIWSD